MSDEFFTHAASQPSGPLSNATRYLCAAAYLHPGFANTVIGELLASHRAVVPSLGIDLVPIIRHCLKARRAQILRDLLLTVFLLAGLLFATTSIIGILIIAFMFGLVLPGVNWERHSVGLKVLAGVMIAAVLALFGLLTRRSTQRSSSVLLPIRCSISWTVRASTRAPTRPAQAPSSTIRGSWLWVITAEPWPRATRASRRIRTPDHDHHDRRTTITGQQDRKLGAGTGEPGFGTNSGIFIGGGNSGVVASGRARITQINHGTNAGDPLELIDRLLRKLEADADALDSDAAGDVIDDAHRLHTEVHSRKLSAENIRAVLARLSAATTSTATLLAAVDQIKDLVAVLLH